ncbi:MAG: FecR domain-containing protein [Planctomycetota bacterium]
MSSQTSERLQSLLDRLGEGEETAADLDNLTREEERWLRDLRGIAASLEPVDEADPGHYDLDTLQRLARERRTEGEGWQMPDHLSACPLCLEEFELLLGEIPTPRRSAVRRYFKQGRKTLAPFGTVLPLFTWRERVVAAAAAAVLAVALGLLFHTPGAAEAPAIRVRGEAFAHVDGRPLRRGATVANGEELVAREDAVATFADGSEVEIDRGSRLAFRVDPAGATTIRLRDGGVYASVTRRTPERPFRVETDLGEVRVVGTAFRVDCERDDVLVLTPAEEGLAGEARTTPLRAVRVTVRAGVVRVTARDGARRDIRAGEEAVLRPGGGAPEVIGHDAVRGAATGD